VALFWWFGVAAILRPHVWTLLESSPARWLSLVDMWGLQGGQGNAGAGWDPWTLNVMTYQVARHQAAVDLQLSQVKESNKKAS